MRGAAQLIHALDADCAGAQPFDSCPQFDEERAQIDDFRLDRRAADDSDAAGQHGGAEDVGRSGHGRAVGAGEVDGCARQSRGRGHDVTVFEAQVGPQRGQALQVQIDRPVADIAAAGQRHDGPASPGQQRSEHAEPRPHPPQQYFRRTDIVIGGADIPVCHGHGIFARRVTDKNVCPPVVANLLDLQAKACATAALGSARRPAAARRQVLPARKQESPPP